MTRPESCSLDRRVRTNAVMLMALLAHIYTSLIWLFCACPKLKTNDYMEFLFVCIFFHNFSFHLNAENVVLVWDATTVRVRGVARSKLNKIYARFIRSLNNNWNWLGLFNGKIHSIPASTIKRYVKYQCLEVALGAIVRFSSSENCWKPVWIRSKFSIFQHRHANWL